MESLSMQMESSQDYATNQLLMEMYQQYGEQMRELGLTLQLKQLPLIDPDQIVEWADQPTFVPQMNIFPNWPQQISHYYNPPIKDKLISGSVSGTSWVNGQKPADVDFTKGCIRNVAWADGLNSSMITPFRNIISGREFALSGSLNKQTVELNFHQYAVAKATWELANDPASLAEFLIGYRVIVFDITTHSVQSGNANQIANLDFMSDTLTFTSKSTNGKLKGANTKYYGAKWTKLKFNAEKGKKYYIALQNLVTIRNEKARSSMELETCIIPWL